MRSLNLILLASTVLTPVIIPAIASADDLEQVERDIVIVTAGRKEQKIEQTAQSVTVIDSEEIKQSQALAIPELLRTVPGVSVTRSGPYGTVVAVKIRGAQSYQTMSMVDGVKLSDPSSTQCDFNLGTIMVGNIDRVEIVRGSQSVLWGSQAMGGVVNMITKKPTEKPETTIQGEYGSDNTQNYVANTSAKLGNLAASLGVNYFKTDGFSAFSEHRGGTEDDGNKNYGANGKLTYDFTKNFSVDVMGFYSKSKGDFDDTGRDALNKQEAEVSIGYVGFNHLAFDGKVKNQLGYSKTTSERMYYYPAWASTYNYEGNVDRYNYQLNYSPREDFGLVFGAEREELDYTIDSGYSVDKQSTKTDSVFLQADARPTEKLSIAAGLRNENHSLYGNHTVFDINGAYALNDGNTIIRLAYGEGYRAPSLYELYDAYSGNRNLVPEESQSSDIGISQRLLDGKLVVGATYFEIKSKNLISWSGRYRNVAEAKSDGYELEAKYAPNKNLTISANYTKTDAIDEITNRSLPRHPENTTNLSVDYAWNFGLKTGFTITHAGDSFDNAANTILTEGYTIGDIRVAYQLNDKVEIYGRVENVTDEEYETVYTYGTPGRSFFGGVRLKF